MEKSEELKMPCVMELGKNELEEIDGGSIIGILAGFVGSALLGALTVEVIIDGSAQCWEDFKEGYNRSQEGR